MGYVFQIQVHKRLIVPKDSGYVPPEPKWKRMISLSGSEVSMLLRFMGAVGAVDLKVTDETKAADCRAGRVPGYKFFFNDGHLVEPKEAELIARTLSQQDVFDPAFLQSYLPKLLQPGAGEALDRAKPLMRLWIAFNKVAAANRGYTVH